MRPINHFVWDAHTASKIDWKHGLTVAGIEYAMTNALAEGTTHRTNHPCRWGYTDDGDYVIGVFEWLDGDTVEMITAFKVTDPRG